MIACIYFDDIIKNVAGTATEKKSPEEFNPSEMSGIPFRSATAGSEKRGKCDAMRSGSADPGYKVCVFTHSHRLCKIYESHDMTLRQNSA